MEKQSIKISASSNDIQIINEFIKGQDPLKSFENGHLQFLKELNEICEKKMKAYLNEGKQMLASDDFLDIHLPQDLFDFLLIRTESSALMQFFKKLKQDGANKE